MRSVQNFRTFTVMFLLSFFQATGHKYGGHSSHVTNVCFLNDDTHLISTGGRDMTVLQFQVVPGSDEKHKGHGGQYAHK